MKPKNLTTEETNELFYDKVYKSNNTFVGYLKLLLSFDQQSKSRINYSFVKNHFNGRIKGLRVLDYGAGRGSLIAKFNRSNQLFGCDISSEAVAHLRNVGSLINKPIVSFKPDEISSHIKDNSLDILTSSHVLEHVPDDKEIVTLFHKKLKPAGILLLNLPVNEVWKDPNHVREYTEDSIIKMMEDYQFEIIETKKAGRINGWMIKKKIAGGIFSKVTVNLLKVLFLLLPSAIFKPIDSVFFGNQVNTHFLALARKK